MSYEKERSSRIAILTDELHDVCNDIYESLHDNDFKAVENSLNRLSELIDYIRKSISNEI